MLYGYTNMRAYRVSHYPFTQSQEVPLSSVTENPVDSDATAINAEFLTQFGLAPAACRVHHPYHTEYHEEGFCCSALHMITCPTAGVDRFNSRQSTPQKHFDRAYPY